MTKHKLFKINQNAVIKNNKSKILILKQLEKWELQGGRLEEDETPQKGLPREIKEETGIENCDIEKIIHVKLSESKNTYMVTFLCHISDDLVVLSNEHTKHAWITPDQLNEYEFVYEETKKLINYKLKS